MQRSTLKTPMCRFPLVCLGLAALFLACGESSEESSQGKAGASGNTDGGVGGSSGKGGSGGTGGGSATGGTSGTGASSGSGGGANVGGSGGAETGGSGGVAECSKDEDCAGKTQTPFCSAQGACVACEPGVQAHTCERGFGVLRLPMRRHLVRYPQLWRVRQELFTAQRLGKMRHGAMPHR